MRGNCSFAAAFGDVLEGARKRRNLTLQMVAERSRMSSAHLFALELGRREPRLGTLIRIARAVGVSPVWLLEEVLAWVDSDETASGTRCREARGDRMRAAGFAFSRTLCGCSKEDLRIVSTTGERLLKELAACGLTVVSLPSLRTRTKRSALIREIHSANGNGGSR
jgi:transcriptional regulator with XRE-family HTH domain